MSNRLSDAMSKLNVNDSARNSLARPSGSTNVKRSSGLDPQTINAMFPDAAAAIASEKAKFAQQMGTTPSSARNSMVDNRNSLVAPTISAPKEEQNPASPWGPNPNDPSRPKSSGQTSTIGQTPMGQAPMGQFVQPPPSAGALRSPRPQITSNTNIQSTTLTAPEQPLTDLPLLSPYGGSGNWASMVNTPLAPTFSQAQVNSPAAAADMVANATAMKLAALSTVNNRFALDDVRKYRRARSNEPGGQSQNNNNNANNTLGSGAPAIPGTITVSDHSTGTLGRDQMMLPQEQNMSFAAHRSRPNSPGIALQNYGAPALPFASPQNNGFLSAYNGASTLLPNGLAPVNFAQFGLGGHHEGYHSDHSEMVRGRSPRGRRGTSKPPEDPTDPTLLQDIPAWLRSLRLHKYTENLKDMKWQELIELDDKQLEERGVNALGARRKMLKVFEQVKGESLSRLMTVRFKSTRC
jgi:SAM domain (Sterile alpha motif).